MNDVHRGAKQLWLQLAQVYQAQIHFASTVAFI